MYTSLVVAVVAVWPIIGAVSMVYLTIRPAGRQRMINRENLTWGDFTALTLIGAILGPFVILMNLLLPLFKARFWKRQVFAKKKVYAK